VWLISTEWLLRYVRKKRFSAVNIYLPRKPCIKLTKCDISELKNLFRRLLGQLCCYNKNLINQFLNYYLFFFAWHYLPVYKLFALLEKPSVAQDQQVYVTEKSIIHIERSEKSVIHIDRDTESTVYGWRNFPSHTCFGPASRLVFLTVWGKSTKKYEESVTLWEGLNFV
jgi:hypothetical protein